jgi:peptidoglycan/xylan/chitin deacetylase (PgdA/CDA1 family)
MVRSEKMHDGLPILMFHSIDDGPSPISFPPKLFKIAISRLHQNGYKTLGVSEAARQLSNGSLQPKSVALTFDDGDLSVYENGWPVLREFGMTATVFLLAESYDGKSDDFPTEFEGRRIINRRQALEMNNAGIEFGAHTVTHPDLRRLTIDEIEWEIRQSKSLLQELLGVSVSSFAYPFGSYDRRCRQVARKHFSCACTDRLALAGVNDDPHELPRVDAYYLRHERLIELMFASSFRWYMLARAVPRRVRRMLAPSIHPAAMSDQIDNSHPAGLSKPEHPTSTAEIDPP